MLKMVEPRFGQAHSQDFALEGGNRSCEGALFFKKLTTFFSRHSQNLSKGHVFAVFEAHRTLLIERIILLY